MYQGHWLEIANQPYHNESIVSLHISNTFNEKINFKGKYRISNLILDTQVTKQKHNKCENQRPYDSPKFIDSTVLASSDSELDNL